MLGQRAQLRVPAAERRQGADALQRQDEEHATQREPVADE